VLLDAKNHLDAQKAFVSMSFLNLISSAVTSLVRPRFSNLYSIFVSCVSDDGALNRVPLFFCFQPMLVAYIVQVRSL